MSNARNTESLVAAWDALGRGDWDALAAFYSEDMIFVIPGQNDVLSGKSAFRTALDNIGEALPPGFEAQVRPRSGLAAKHGITVLNTPGTIDADYRGEVKIILINLGHDDFVIERGMRIAQMVIAPVVQAQTQIVDSLSDTQRGDGGFGSTGTGQK